MTEANRHGPVSSLLSRDAKSNWVICVKAFMKHILFQTSFIVDREVFNDTQLFSEQEVALPDGRARAGGMNGVEVRSPLSLMNKV